MNAEHSDSIRAMYDHSVDRYVEAVGTTLNPEFETDADRALIDAFADLIRGPGHRVIDIGCGPGRVAARLAHLGLDAAGCDISPGMIAAARHAHPHLTFDVAPIDHLPFADATLTGAVLWYSIIHTAPDDLIGVWRELARVLAPNGRVLLAFQAGDNDRIERTDQYGSGTTLTFFRHDPHDVAESLRSSEFEVDTEICRPAQLSNETSPQAFLTAHRA